MYKPLKIYTADNSKQMVIYFSFIKSIVTRNNLEVNKGWNFTEQMKARDSWECSVALWRNLSLLKQNNTIYSVISLWRKLPTFKSTEREGDES